MRHIIPISGKDSLCTALVQIKLEPHLDYEFVFNPTGAELPCVFEWLDKVEAYLGKPIARVGEDLLEIIEENNYFLPSRQSRYCTRQSKIEPFEKWIGKDDCIVYYGIRADEVRGGYINAKFANIVPKYTLKEQGIGISGVYSIINEAGLKPPSFFLGKRI
jgi:3'-phosphoadenosine 5'-phosphosulfate sulfotransferase (PAPS reductase)/FAD synthetase